MPQDCLALELRLLLLKHGKQAVLRQLAGLQDVSVDEFERELATLESRKADKRAKPVLDKDECIARLGLKNQEKEVLLRQLAGRFEMGAFLPSLREVERFAAQRHERLSAKSRRNALPRMLQILAGLDNAELRELLETGSDSPDDRGFAVMADLIMTKS